MAEVNFKTPPKGPTCSWTTSSWCFLLLCSPSLRIKGPSIPPPHNYQADSWDTNITKTFLSLAMICTAGWNWRLGIQILPPHRKQGNGSAPTECSHRGVPGLDLRVLKHTLIYLSHRSACCAFCAMVSIPSMLIFWTISSLAFSTGALNLTNAEVECKAGNKEELVLSGSILLGKNQYCPPWNFRACLAQIRKAKKKMYLLSDN